MKLAVTCSLLLLSAAELVAAIAPIGHVRREIEKRRSQLESRQTVAAAYQAHNLSVPIDHFPNVTKYEPHSTDKFNTRYYFDDSYYKPGGPVIILLGGETSVTGRIPFLQKGILAQLIQATNGLGVILEHRYYGTSIPTPDLSVESLRFLTTEQALADVDYFAKNIVFPGWEHSDLTSPNTPYILYGGSYAGGQAAFLRVTYPDTFWGAIASSGVVKAIYHFWEYYDIIRQFGPRDCIKTVQKFTNIVDNILLKQNNSETVDTLKAAFSLSGLTYNDDFANQLASGVGWWQSRNWDPAVGYPDFDLFCSNVTDDTVLYPATEALRGTAKDLIKIGGWGAETNKLTNRFLNYFGWVNLTSATPCLADGSTLDECYSYHDPSIWGGDEISQWPAKSWTWQYCTEWGYFQTGTPPSGLPIISKTIDLDYFQLTCSLPFNITTPPDVEAVNKYGAFDIRYDRLAFIDGEADPWRAASTHADTAPKRNSSINEPFEVIPDAVHHWDENGLYPNETKPGLPPKTVLKAQKFEREFVKAWLKEWEVQHAKRSH